MAEFKFHCPHCQQKMACNETMSGRQIVCPACNHLITIPPAPGHTAEKPQVGQTWATFPPRPSPKTSKPPEQQ
jgi:DNA-directed RNA polymerase subunit RPC12/RpoP